VTILIKGTTTGEQLSLPEMQVNDIKRIKQLLEMFVLLLTF
jgi:hypothetical protein